MTGATSDTDRGADTGVTGPGATGPGSTGPAVTGPVAPAPGPGARALTALKALTARFARLMNRPAWRRGRVVAAIAVLVTLPAAFHRFVPNTPGHWGSFLETFLPWGGLVVPPLLVAAAVRRSWTAAIAACLPLVVWLAMFGQFLVPGRGGGPYDLRVVTHNVNAVNADPAGTARQLAAADPDVIALQELPEGEYARYGAVLDALYPHHAHRGTVALWSRHPVANVSDVDVGMGFTRAMRLEIRTPRGDLAMYVAHLASVRFGGTGFGTAERDATIRRLADAVAADPAGRIMLVGDLNGTTDDRALYPLTRRLRDVQNAVGGGFGFTWPARFPLAAIDHVLVRGLEPVSADVLARTPSDHRPVRADVRF
jgi:vancomycin resistance protein VanJ